METKTGTLTNPALAQQLLDAIDEQFGLHPGFRPAHAKGLMCSGLFTPSSGAANLTSAPHASRPQVRKYGNGQARQITNCGYWLAAVDVFRPGQKGANHEEISVAFKSAGFDQPDEDKAGLDRIAIDARQFHDCGVTKSVR